MSDIVQTLASETGLDLSSIQKAIGTILNLLKSHLPEEVFAQIQDKIPHSTKMVEDAADSQPQQESGGILGAATKLAGQVFGSKLHDGASLVEQVNKLGIDPSALVSILAGLYKFLSSHLPPEVMAQIGKALPNLPGLSLVSEEPANEEA